jgi:hypothetical protein
MLDATETTTDFEKYARGERPDRHREGHCEHKNWDDFPQALQIAVWGLKEKAHDV